MTALQRKAEERERALKKLLKECEVSNLDIENRLREVDEPRAGHDKHGSYGKERALRKRDGSGPTDIHPSDSMHDRMSLALTEELGSGFEENGVSTEGFHGVYDQEATVRGKFAPSMRNEDGWKGYFGIGTSQKSSRASSIASYNEDEAEGYLRTQGAQPKRKGLNNELFKPPVPSHRAVSTTTNANESLRRIRSNGQEQPDPQSRKASGTIAGWATKLIAGSTQTKTEEVNGTSRGRSATTGAGFSKFGGPSYVASTTSRSSTQHERSTSVAGPKAKPARSSLGPNGTLKNVSSEVTRSMKATSVMVVTSPNEALNRNLSNIGPVEMDTILPEETRPPTLNPYFQVGRGSDFLTDRFGFIYDQRRRKRQSEAAVAALHKKHARNSTVETIGNARSVLNPTHTEESELTVSEPTSPLQRLEVPTSIEELQSQPAARWTDFLKLATFPTELLSHTPSAGPITTVEGGDSDTNPEPSASQIPSSNAEIAQPSTSGASTPIGSDNANQPDPVKSLLEQMTELHDCLQRIKEPKWNDFFRKVRTERKREGEATTYTDGRLSKHAVMPEASLADGELIGVAGLGNKGKIGRNKWKEFKQLVLGGIPVAYRPKVWAECSGAATLRIPGYYEDLVNSDTNDDPVIAQQIQMDITRTLTDNIYFRKGVGVSRLNEVLVAYSRRNPEVGYCQGMNLITAYLLLTMPTAEDAFWILTTMIENILPRNYYDHSLLTSRADQVVLRQYVAEILPKLSAHLDDLSIELEALTFQWFLSVFTDCLSAEALFRVWDVVLCVNDGSTFLFQVALALLKLNEGNLIKEDTAAGVYHYINHSMTNHAISIDGLIQASEALRKVVKRPDVEERRRQAVEAERQIMKSREEVRSGKKPVKHVDGLDGIAESVVAQKENTPPLSSTPSRPISPDEVGLDEFGDMEVRTPMPIDEEALWRA
ncbi:hypothetical protein B0A49_09260 [Cryomyces minteri]|uniref:Rab-GAP TBC domain-containing protein n=1 Tax=Cryomyces minteri TaxID=331657 RepID=A0A4V5NG72_9PEZI|nr:hypothetical protein B0A49_09260 [Cryomyces minteri]